MNAARLAEAAIRIDGDHTEAGARADYVDYAPFVRDGGIVAFHDIVEHPDVPECRVVAVWREISSREDVAAREFVAPGDERGWGPWGGIGVIESRPGVRIC